MSESERLVKFTLLGQNFAFYTGASEEEMEKILALVREQIESIGGGDKPGGTIPVSKIAVMACLNLASNYLKLKQEHSQYKEETALKLGELSDRLDFILVDEG
jgi:cell division protein ZapA